MIINKKLFLLLLGCFIFWVPATSFSVTMEVSTGYSFDIGTDGSVDGGDGNNQTAASGELDSALDIPGLRSFEDPWEEDPSNTGTAMAAADEDGVTAVRIDGSSAAGSNTTWELSAQTRIAHQVTPTGLEEFDYTFQIFRGTTLSVFDYGGPTSDVSYSLEINLVDEVLNTTQTLWETGGRLSGNSPYGLRQWGNALPIDSFNDDLGILTYVFFGALGNINFIMANQFSLEIIMNVGGTMRDFENGLMAFIGDPGDLSDNPGFTGTLTRVTNPPNGIPEPGTLVLLATGLLGFAGISRKGGLRYL